MTYIPPPRKRREDLATLTLMLIDGEWHLDIDVNADESYGAQRRGKDPGALLRWAERWAADRGLILGMITTSLYRLVDVEPVRPES